jgi:hypothetical protein
LLLEIFREKSGRVFFSFLFCFNLCLELVWDNGGIGLAFQRFEQQLSLMIYGLLHGSVWRDSWLFAPCCYFDDITTSE